MNGERLDPKDPMAFSLGSLYAIKGRGPRCRSDPAQGRPTHQKDSDAHNALAGSAASHRQIRRSDERSRTGPETQRQPDYMDTGLIYCCGAQLASNRLRNKQRRCSTLDKKTAHPMYKKAGIAVISDRMGRTDEPSQPTSNTASQHGRRMGRHQTAANAARLQPACPGNLRRPDRQTN